MINDQIVLNKLDRVIEELNRIESLVSKRDRPFLTLEEACEYLGLSKATIYGYTSKSIIPYHKLQDRRLYFDIDDLNKFILNKKNRHQCNSEINAEASTRFITDKMRIKK